MAGYLRADGRSTQYPAPAFRQLKPGNGRWLYPDGGANGRAATLALAIGRPDAAPRLLDAAAAQGGGTLGDWLRGHAEELGHAVFGERIEPFEDLPMRGLTDWVDVVRPFAWPG